MLFILQIGGNDKCHTQKNKDQADLLWLVINGMGILMTNKSYFWTFYTE